MAKSSTLARNIDKNFLECGICFSRFKDPRGLPCLHAFCYQCLVDWAKTCSENRSIVVCPLCKKVFPIPDDGFPVHFLVTNLREAVDTDRKPKIDDKHKYCRQHDGELKRFFCETCCVAVCPECCALDPNHQGHKFTRLDDAKNKQATALQDFIGNFEEVRQKYSDAIQQTEQTEDDLKNAIQQVNEDLEQLKEHYTRRLEATFEKHKDDVDRVWVQRSEKLCEIKHDLENSLVTLQTAYERGTEVVNSGSQYEIFSAYEFMSSALKDAAVPAAADPTLGCVGFEANRIEITSVGKLTCGNDTLYSEDLEGGSATCLEPTTHVSKDATADLAMHKPTGSTDSGHGTNTGHLVGRPQSTYQTDQQPSSSDQRPGSYREMTGLRRWKPTGYFKSSPAAERPKAIAIHANGDIAVTSRKSPMTVFSKGGDVKCIQKGSLCNASDITTNLENQYIVTGNNEIKVYSSKWFGTRRLFSFPTYDFNNQLSSPSAVGVDSRGRIIVGIHDGKTVSIHMPGGAELSRFETSQCPRRLAVTPNDELVITFDNNTIQVMSQLGHTTKIIQPPSGVEWEPWYICCSMQGQLLVCNQGNPKAVFMYIFRNGEYRITDCLITLENNGFPYGIALSRDGRELFVVDRANNSVRKFML